MEFHLLVTYVTTQMTVYRLKYKIIDIVKYVQTIAKFPELIRNNISLSSAYFFHFKKQNCFQVVLTTN